MLKNLDKLNKTLASNENSTFHNRIITIGSPNKIYVYSNYNNLSLLEIYKQAKADVILSNNKTIREINAMRAFMRLINMHYSLEDLEDITPEIFGTMLVRVDKEYAKFIYRMTN